MKTVIKILKTVIIVVDILLLLICASELYEFLKDSNSYHLGSEAMIENGGWSYSSNFTFIFFNSIMIILSILLSFLAFRSKKIKFLLLILLLVICQIGCLILL
ncbi:MAG TPA: hypothetical protein PLQ91_04920 [Bacteroidales bacterium]|jgi:hypothetical protein|nr:hypothetical protein [Bacteroidales bacterium]